MKRHTTSASRSLAAMTLAIALVLSACGDGTAVPSEDGDLLPPVPVRVSSAGNGSAAAGAAETSSLDAAMSMIAPWVTYDFVVGSGMPALPTTGNGWQYASGATPDPAAVARIAAALGVAGEVVQMPADQGGGWTVGPNDGSAPSLWISADGQLSWWFSAPYLDDGRAAEGCAVSSEPLPPEAGASDDGVAATDTTEPAPADEPDCGYEPPTPPSGILSADQARSRATDLLVALGVDPAAFELEVYADEWYASVSAMQRLGGVASPIGWYFGFGAEGRLDSAGGTLATPFEVGPYPLVDLDTAIVRLRDGFYGSAMPYAADAVLGGDAAVTSGLAPDLLCEEGTDCSQPLPEPETVTVTLTGVEQDYWWAWDPDGTVWLLPAFTFIATDGGRWTVPAVTDDYLIIDDVPGDPTLEDPAPGPAPDAAIIGDGESDALIGLSEDEALAAAAGFGWEVRVVARDGERYAVTDDYSPTRVNLTIEAGTVTAVSVG